MQQLSTIISSYCISGYLTATSLQDSKNRPSASFIMLALCTAVTFFLLFTLAYSNANFAIRSEQYFVITWKKESMKVQDKASCGTGKLYRRVDIIRRTAKENFGEEKKTTPFLRRIKKRAYKNITKSYRQKLVKLQKKEFYKEKITCPSC